MAERFDEPPGPVPSADTPAPSRTPTEPRTPPAAEPGPLGRYDANINLIRFRRADEDRMKAKRRWKLPF